MWSTDSNGNFTANSAHAVGDAALQGLETFFHQDLDGDGQIGLAPILLSADQPDYAPGSTAVFTAANVAMGGTVDFTVDHVVDGQLVDDLTGTGITWAATDGGAGDLDGVANGVVVTKWYVNDDAANQAFQLTAVDDTTGVVATTPFTDTPKAPAYPPADPGEVLNHLEVSHTTAVINGATFESNVFDTVSGTGVFPSFVQIDGNPNNTEQGYNYDNAGGIAPQFQEGNSAPHNHAVLLSSIAEVVHDGVLSYVFALDSNEPNSSTKLISLDALQIYTASSGSLTNFDQPSAEGGSGTGFGASAHLVYDIDQGADVAVILDSQAAGSGKPDLGVFIPVSAFGSVDEAHTYIYLYSAFGQAGSTYASNSGFEEWSTPLIPSVNPVIAIDKVTTDGSVTGDGITTFVGNSIAWTYTVTNPGNVPLSNVYVVDDNGTPGDTSDDFTITAHTGDDGNGVLDVGESWVFTATGTAQLGPYNNIGTAHGTYFGADVTATDPSSYVGQNPNAELAITKDTVCPEGGESIAGGTVLVGNDVEWTYKVTSTGNSVSNVVVTDDNGTLFDTSDDFTAAYVSGDTNSNGKLDPGETWLFATTGPAQAGAYENVAQVTGTNVATGGGVEADSNFSSYFGVTLGVEVKKEVSVDGGQTWQDANTAKGPTLLDGHDTPEYRITVTNDSNIAQTVNLNDVMDGNSFDLGGNSSVSLAANGGSTSFIINGTWSAGQHTNTVTASEDFIDGCENPGHVEASDSANYFGLSPSLDLSKSIVCVEDGKALDNGVQLLDGPVHYEVTIHNSGNVALTGVHVVDAEGLDQTVDLALNQTLTFDYTGTWVAGSHTNTVEATYQVSDSAGDVFNGDKTDTANFFGVTLGVEVKKEVSVDGGQTWEDANTAKGPTLLDGHDAPEYRITVTNDSNIAQTVNLNDVMDGNSFDLGGNSSVSLAANGGSTSFIINGTWSAGQHTNTVTASEDFIDGCENPGHVEASDSANYFGAAPDVGITKSIICQDDGDSLTGSAIHLLKGSDGLVHYEIVVTNSGNVDLTAPVITDSLEGTLLEANATQSGGIADDGILQAGETWTFDYTMAWAATPLDGGPTTNTADVSASFTDGGHNTWTDDPEASVGYIGLDPHISLIKLTNGVDGAKVLAGQTIHWTYDATNTGNVDLTGVQVTDSPSQNVTAITDLNHIYNTGDVNNDGIMEVGETWHFQATGTAINTSSLAGGIYTNTATATTNDVTDDCGNSVQVSAQDGSSYTGLGIVSGLSKGYWANHSWSGVDPNAHYDSHGVLSGTLILGDSNGVLAGDGIANATDTFALTFDAPGAQLLDNSSTTGDARYILGGQLVAAELNSYQMHVTAKGLLGAGAEWFYKYGGQDVDSIKDSIATDTSPTGETVSSAEWSNTGKNGFNFLEGPAISTNSGSGAWNSQDLFTFSYHSTLDNADHVVGMTGEGLKNALSAFDHGLVSSSAGLVLSTDGSLIAWQDTGGVDHVYDNTVGTLTGVNGFSNVSGGAFLAVLNDEAHTSGGVSLAGIHQIS